jgi:creatinine amidohydrolase
VTHVSLEQLTWPDAEALRGQRAVGLIPTGAIEQHGPHLPLATDAIIAEYLAREVAGRLVEPVVVAPVLPGGISSHHLEFPGTVDLGEDVVTGYLRAYVDTMTKLGIEDVAVFSAHGGNFALLGRFAADWAQAGGVRVIAYTDLVRYLAVMMRAAEGVGLSAPETDAHAGGLETSQMMFLLGEDAIQVPEAEGYTAAEPGWMDRLFAEGMKSLTPIGVLGRVQGASAKAGEAISNALVDELVTWLVDAFALAAPLSLPASSSIGAKS